MDTVVIFRGKVFKIKWGRHNPQLFWYWFCLIGFITPSFWET